MENTVKEMVTKINGYVDFINEDYEEKNEDYRRAISKLRGMVDMLEIVTCKCYVAEVFHDGKVFRIK